MPWVFPDQAYEMNRKGVKFSVFSSGSRLDADVGHESPWAAHERQVAMERVYNTEKANRGMEGKINTSDRLQRYQRPASRSAVPNGVFHGSPMKYTTSGNAFTGGRIYTKEGQEWLAKRLQERTREYEDLSTGTVSTPAQPIPLSSHTQLDTLLSQIFVSFEAGSFTSSVATALNMFLGELIKVGATITPSELAKYSRSIDQLYETIRSYRPSGELQSGLGGGIDYEPDQKRIRFVNTLIKTLKLISAAIKEIARTINESLSSRELVMSKLFERLVGRQAETYEPSLKVYGAERQEMVREAQPVSMGGPPSRLLPESLEERLIGEEGEREQLEQITGLGRRRNLRKY